VGSIYYRQDLVDAEGEPILTEYQNVAVIYYKDADVQIVGWARESSAPDILPTVQQEVNTLPEFEPLRRVYMSRVAAQWVRQVAGRNTVLGRLVNSGLHRAQRAKPAWSPDAIWEQYLQQFDAPPMKWTTSVQVNGVTENFTGIAYGGVDFRKKVPMKNTSTGSFKAHYPGLAAAAKNATKRATTIGSVTLVGGGTTITRRRYRRPKQPPVLRIPSSVIPGG
jgi:hypothetical protein